MEDTKTREKADLAGLDENLTARQINGVIDRYCEGKSLGRLEKFRDRLLEEQEGSETTLVPIASGKGGVGKTNMAVALSLALSDYGFSVGLFDLDMASNTHYLMGLRRPDIEHTLIDYLESEDLEMADIGHRVYPKDDELSEKYDTLRFHPGVGAGDDRQREMSTMINYQQYRRLLRGITDSDRYDYVVMDLPAGTETKQVTFYSPYQAETSEVDRFISRGRSRRLLVLNYSPNSYEASVIFLEHVISRELKNHFSDNDYVNELKKMFRERLRKRMSKSSEKEREHIINSRYYFELIKKAGQYKDEIGEKLEEYLRTFHTEIICNSFGDDTEEARQRFYGEQYHSGDEASWDLGLLPDLKPQSFTEYFAEKYQFGDARLEPSLLGYVPRDAKLVSEAERNGRSFYTEDDRRTLSNQVRKMAKKLTGESRDEDDTVLTDRDDVLSIAVSRVNHHIDREKKRRTGES